MLFVSLPNGIRLDMSKVVAYQKTLRPPVTLDAPKAWYVYISMDGETESTKFHVPDEAHANAFLEIMDAVVQAVGVVT